MYYRKEQTEHGETFVEVEPIRRWYCYAEDNLFRCQGYLGPTLYDPNEWNDEHNDCGWIEILSGTVQGELEL